MRAVDIPTSEVEAHELSRFSMETTYEKLSGRVNCFIVSILCFESDLCACTLFACIYSDITECTSLTLAPLFSILLVGLYTSFKVMHTIII